MIEVDVCDCQMRLIEGFKGDGMMIEGVTGCCSYTYDIYSGGPNNLGSTDRGGSCDRLTGRLRSGSSESVRLT